MKRNEAVYTAIDIGSSKITTLMAHFNLDGNLEIIGVGTVDSSGIHKGIVKMKQNCQKTFEYLSMQHVSLVG